MDKEDLGYLEKVRLALLSASAVLKLAHAAATYKNPAVDEVLGDLHDAIIDTSGRIAQLAEPADYPTWEHKVFVLNSDALKDAEDKMNELGAEGWELASTVYMPSRVAENRTVYYMKR